MLQIVAVSFVTWDRRDCMNQATAFQEEVT